MKKVLADLLPTSAVNALQRAKLKLSLLKPYKKTPFSLADISGRNPKSGYANKKEKASLPFQKIMAKLNSYAGAGPIGPNKFWEYPWTLQTLDLKPELKILDGGCGRSPLQYLLAEMGMAVSGTDPNENVGWHGIDRRLAKKFGLSIDYRVEGMEKISYADETFDRVMSISVLEHCRAKPVENDLLTPQTKEDRTLQAKMAGELARVLKPGGLLVLTLDILFPTSNVLLEANVDVRNLVEATGLTLLSPPSAGYFGQPDFDMNQLANRPGLDTQDYAGVKGTSLALVFRK